MKRMLFASILSAALALSVVFSCAVSVFASDFESEDNDSASNANAVAVNTDVHASCDKEGDADFFKFSLPSDGYISVGMECARSSSTCTLAFLSGSSTLVSSSFSCRSTEYTTGKLGLSKGSYYLRISFDGKESVGTGYSFTINFTASSLWETEDNDSADKADPVSIGDRISGVHNSTSDDDFFSFKLSESGYIYLELENERGEGKYSAEILSGSGSAYVECSFSRGEGKHTSQKIGLSRGTYCLKITSGSSAAADGEYSFKIVSVAAERWESEPNGTVKTADEVSVDTSVTGVHNSPSDIDLFAFSLSMKSSVTVELSSVKSSGSLTLDLLDGGGNLLQTTPVKCTSTQNKTPRINLGKGSFILRVKAESDALTGIEYSFKINRYGESKNAPVASILTTAAPTTAAPAETETVWAEDTTVPEDELTTVSFEPERPDETDAVEETTVPEDELDKLIDGRRGVVVYVWQEEYTFLPREDGDSVELVSYIGSSRIVNLPENINGRPLTEIGAYAFSDSDVTTLYIPDRVTLIADTAFDGIEEDLMLYCSETSAAAQLARSREISYFSGSVLPSTTAAPPSTDGGEPVSEQPSDDGAPVMTVVIYAVVAALAVAALGTGAYFLTSGKRGGARGKEDDEDDEDDDFLLAKAMGGADASERAEQSDVAAEAAEAAEADEANEVNEAAEADEAAEGETPPDSSDTAMTAQEVEDTDDFYELYDDEEFDVIRRDSDGNVLGDADADADAPKPDASDGGTPDNRSDTPDNSDDAPKSDGSAQGGV